jgi:glutathione S-transferase
MLKELGVNFELVFVDRKSQSQKSEDYLRINPTGRIPTLVDGGQAIFESGAIALYLSEKHPEGKLIPPLDTPERALCYQWLFYLTSTLQPELMVYFYPEKHTNNVGNYPGIVIAQEHRITQMFSVLDDQIGGNNYLVGNTITICDYFLFMLCHWGSEFKRPPLDFPNLGRCLKGLASRDSFQEVCATEGTSLEIYG